MNRDSGSDTRVRIPADTERPDRILAGLTARQLAILAITGLLLYAGYAATRGLLPPLAFAVLAFPVSAAGGALALGRHDGVGLDRLAAAALAHARTPRRQVPADADIPATPGWAHWPAPPPPARLALPAGSPDSDGIIDLGAAGAAVVCRCAPVNFALRTPAEQRALIGAFGRFCNAAAAPMQLLVRAVPVDLTEPIRVLQDAAGGLPHPALEAAAREHATFLTELAARTDLLRRDLLLVLRQPAATGGRGRDPAALTGRLARRAEEAASALAAAGIAVEILDGPASAAVLAAAADPGTRRPAGLSPPGAVITGPDGLKEDFPWFTD